MQSKEKQRDGSTFGQIVGLFRYIFVRTPLFQTSLKQANSTLLSLPTDVIHVIASKLDPKSLQALSQCSSGLFSLSKNIHVNNLRKHKLAKALSSNDIDTVTALLVEQPGLWRMVLPLKANNYQPEECKVKMMNLPTFAYWTNNPALIRLSEQNLTPAEIAHVKQTLSVRGAPKDDDLDAGTHFKFEARGAILQDIVDNGWETEKQNKANAIWHQLPAWARDAEWDAVVTRELSADKISCASDDDVISWSARGWGGMGGTELVFGGYWGVLRFLDRTAPVSTLSSSPTLNK